MRNEEVEGRWKFDVEGRDSDCKWQHGMDCTLKATLPSACSAYRLACDRAVEDAVIEISTSFLRPHTVGYPYFVIKYLRRGMQLTVDKMTCPRKSNDCFTFHYPDSQPSCFTQDFKYFNLTTSLIWILDPRGTCLRGHDLLESYLRFYWYLLLCSFDTAPSTTWSHVLNFFNALIFMNGLFDYDALKSAES